MTEQAWWYADGAVRLRGLLHAPTVAPNGRAVLVVHEADGIGQNVRRRCAMLADLGYVAAAADMHGDGRTLGGDEIAPALARFRADAGLIRGRIGAALDALGAATGIAPTATAAIGYCFGGYAVLELARSGVALAAAASFHGLLTSPAPAGPGTLRTPLLVATGARDPLVPAEDVAAFAREMTEAGADWHLLTHGRARHSFSNAAVDGLGDPRMAYDPAADAVSWAAAMAFFDHGFAVAAGR